MFILGTLNLKTLPDCIGDLTLLTFLDLSNNKLTKLPERIGDLTSLTELRLDFNQLTKLPERIGDLTSLSWLQLRGNRLTELPERIGDLTSLTWLELNDNQLTELPERIGDLTSLTKLELRGNQLTELPERIGDLTSLIFLDLSKNKLTKLPERIGDLTSLKFLCADDNPLTFLSQEIGDMPAFQAIKENKALLSLPTTRPPSAPATHASAKPAVTTTTSTTLPAHSNPPDPLTLTPDQSRRLAQLLSTDTPLQQGTFTPEQHATLTALATMEQDIIDAVTSQSLVMQGGTPSPEEMEKLIQFIQIKFADDSKKRQWAAEVGALKTVYPTTAEGGQKLYNLLFKALIALSNNTAQDVSGIDGANHGMVSTGAVGFKTMAGLFRLVPLGGNQLADGAKAGISAIDSRRMASGLLKGLDAAETVGNDGTLLQREATMHRMAHALSYRLAMHHCEKKNSPGSASGQQSGNAAAASDIPTAAFRTYTNKIFAAFMQPEKTFADNDPDLAVTSLLTVALTKVAGSIRDRSPARAREIAQELGKKHQQIIDRLMSPAGSGAVPAAAGTGATPQSGHLPGTSTPTPDAARQTGVHLLTAQMAQIVQQFGALNSEQQALKAQQEEDRRTVQTLQNANQELMAQHQALKMQHQDVKAQQEEDKRAVQTLQSENQKLKVQHQEVKAQQDEDKRTVQMLQNANQELMALLAQTNQRFAAMENENHTLRTELETLSNKPADPMIGVLNHAVDGLNAQLASLQTNLNQTHRSTASAHAELQTLTPQLHSLHGALANLKEDVNTLQVSLDDTPEKAAVAELGDQVAGLVQDKHRADADLRMLKKSVSKLKPETDIDTSSDGPLAAALMPRDEPGQGQLAQGQNIQIQIAELNARTNDHAQRLDVLQDDAGIAQMQPAASGPSEDNNLRRLLGNLWNGEGRR
ncbi:MAG: hypothetical protein ACI802_002615 [Candidatus Paceibacteria bacterium]|jgi:hypothetical protein